MADAVVVVDVVADVEEDMLPLLQQLEVVDTQSHHQPLVEVDMLHLHPHHSLLQLLVVLEDTKLLKLPFPLR